MIRVPLPKVKRKLRRRLEQNHDSHRGTRRKTSSIAAPAFPPQFVRPVTLKPCVRFRFTQPPLVSGPSAAMAISADS